MPRNQNNVSEWRDMSTCLLWFQWVSTARIQLNVLVYFKVDIIEFNLFSLLIQLKITHLALSNNHLLTHSNYYKLILIISCWEHYLKLLFCCNDGHTDKGHNYVNIVCLHVFSSVLRCPWRFLLNNNVRFAHIAICLVGVSCFICMLFVFIYALVSKTISISDDVHFV